MKKFEEISVEELLKELNISISELEHLVERDKKKRYSFNSDHTKVYVRNINKIKDTKFHKKKPPDIRK